MLESLIARLIYYPDPLWITTPDQMGLHAEELSLVPEPGVQIHAWFLPHLEPVASLLFCHGNAGNVSHRLENVALLLRVGFQVLLFDYRGYGHSTGSPSEEGLYCDAMLAWECLIERTGAVAAPRVIFGRSLGGCVAVELATRAEADGLILESTFTSIRTLARLVLPPPLPALPAQYDSLSKIGELRMPLLAIHGDRDELIPMDDGRRLFEAAPEPKCWYPIAGAGHNDTYLAGGRAYFDRLVSFARSLGQVASPGKDGSVH